MIAQRHEPRYLISLEKSRVLTFSSRLTFFRGAENDFDCTELTRSAVVRPLKRLYFMTQCAAREVVTDASESRRAVGVELVTRGGDLDLERGQNTEEVG